MFAVIFFKKFLLCENFKPRQVFLGKIFWVRLTLHFMPFFSWSSAQINFFHKIENIQRPKIGRITPYIVHKEIFIVRKILFIAPLIRKMVVIRGLLIKRQFISAPIKIIYTRRSRGLMIILPARRSRAKVKCLAHERSECRQGIYWHE